MTEFAATEWERAQRTLASAKLLAETDPDSAASRAYYAAFHALTAAFALRDQKFSKHSAIRAALHRDLVKPGLLPPEAARDYDYLMDARETGDYGGAVQVSMEGAREAVERAGSFLAVIRVLACPSGEGEGGN